MGYKLTVTESFESDLDNVLEYISQKLLNPAAADRLLKRTEEKINLICENPFMYPLYHDDTISEKGYHYAVVSNYILFYTVEETEKIIILSRFLYGGQNILNVL